MAAKKKPEKKKKEDTISLENWRIINNIPDGKFNGFKTTLNLEEEFTETELNKAYKKYCETPVFINKGG